MESSFGWEPGSFVKIYASNRQEASETLLANEPLADAIEKLLEGGGEYAWIGTATQLLEVLSFYVNDSIKRSKAWPGGPQALSRRLKRIAPALRSAGIEYTENELGHRKKKVKTLRKLARDDEEAQDTGEEAREDEADPDGEVANGEEEVEDQTDSDGEERRVGNPFASNDNEADDPEGQGEEREH